MITVLRETTDWDYAGGEYHINDEELYWQQEE